MSVDLLLRTANSYRCSILKGVSTSSITVGVGCGMRKGCLFFTISTSGMKIMTVIPKKRWNVMEKIAQTLMDKGIITEVALWVALWDMGIQRKLLSGCGLRGSNGSETLATIISYKGRIGESITMNFNKAFLGGHLTHDPEVQFTTAGTAMCNFQIAVNDNYTNKDGELVEQVDFFRFTAFGNQAEFIGEFFHKGKQSSSSAVPSVMNGLTRRLAR